MKTSDENTALITGASKGLGAEIARKLANQGCRLVVVARNAERLDTLLYEIKKKNKRKHLAYTGDLTQSKNVKGLLSLLKSNKISPSIIVHNLGGSLKTTDAYAKIADWKNVWNLNLGVAIELNNALIPNMISKKYGRIVHISSVSASTYNGYPAYVSAKCALHGYVKSVSRHLAPENVIMSAVAPGPIREKGRFLASLEESNTDDWKMYCKEHLAINRLADPKEIADVVCFLCTQDASFCSGAVFNVDGCSS